MYVIVWRDTECDPKGYQTVDLTGSDLNDFDLGFAQLAGADLRGTNLESAYLEGADLQQALVGTFRGQQTNLRYANLRGADLRGIKFGSYTMSDDQWNVWGAHVSGVTPLNVFNMLKVTHGATDDDRNWPNRAAERPRLFGGVPGCAAKNTR